MNNIDAKNLTSTEQDFIGRVKLDLAYTKNQLMKVQNELAEKDELLRKKDIQIRDMTEHLKQVADAYKIKEAEYRERVNRLEELAQPETREINNGFTRALNWLGITVSVTE